MSNSESPDVEVNVNVDESETEVPEQPDTSGDDTSNARF